MIRRRTNIGNGLKFPSLPTQFLRGDNLGTLYTNATELSYEYMFLTTTSSRLQVTMRAVSGNWASQIRSDNKLSLRIFGGSGSGSSYGITVTTDLTIEPNRIYHVLFVNDGLNLQNSITCYVNGLEVSLSQVAGESTFPFVPESNSRNGITFGQFAPDGSAQNPATFSSGNYFEGTVYRTALYDRVITVSEAYDLAYSKTPLDIASTNLLHYCDYNQVRGVGFESRTVLDLSGNNLPLYASGFGTTIDYGGGAWVDSLQKTSK